MNVLDVNGDARLIKKGSEREKNLKFSKLIEGKFLFPKMNVL